MFFAGLLSCERMNYLRRLAGRAATTALLVGIWCGASADPHAAASKELKIYFVDVEGGQASLFVTPTGESLLIDTGWGGNNGRDADRIAAAAKNAGISKIDYVLITHFHADHVGGVPQLVQKIPVGTFIDHGDTRETGANADKLFAAYKQAFADGEIQAPLGQTWRYSSS